MDKIGGAGRQLVTRIPHPQGGWVPNVALPIRYSRTPVVDPVPAPSVGQHTSDVLSKVLGYDEDRLARLAESGALGELARKQTPSKGAGPMRRASTERTLRGRVAVVGIGEIDYYPHDASPDAEFKLALKAVLAACADAGVDPRDIDGFASYSDDADLPVMRPAKGARHPDPPGSYSNRLGNMF